MLVGAYWEHLKPQVGRRAVCVYLYSSTETEILDVKLKYRDEHTDTIRNTNYCFTIREREKIENFMNLKGEFESAIQKVDKVESLLIKGFRILYSLNKEVKG